MIREHISDALRKLREGAGLSQAVLARRMGVAQGTVSKIEAGERLPPLDTVETWARACGCSVRIEFRPISQAELLEERAKNLGHAMIELLTHLGTAELVDPATARALTKNWEGLLRDAYALVGDFNRLHGEDPQAPTSSRERLLRSLHVLVERIARRAGRLATARLPHPIARRAGQMMDLDRLILDALVALLEDGTVPDRLWEPLDHYLERLSRMDVPDDEDTVAARDEVRKILIPISPIADGSFGPF